MGAVKAATDAGAAACQRVGTLISAHVIPRPHSEIDVILPKGPEDHKPKGRRKRGGRKKKVQGSEFKVQG